MTKITSANKAPVVLALFFFLFLIPALFVNLGQIPTFVHVDEPRRALVSLEMQITGEYITPTLNGEYYFNKPPLYNWLIVGSNKLFGEVSEFSLRFPMALSILLYGLSVFLILRRRMDELLALATAVATITAVRLLLYDAFLGLIDITFSWVVFLQIYSFYHYGKDDRYGRLFAISWTLAGIGFLMKGVPSLAFQGLSIIAYAVYRRDKVLIWRQANFLGAMLFAVIVGGYYTLYLMQHPGGWEDILFKLYDEVGRRTGVRFGLLQTILHLFTFPFEFAEQFLPWSLLAVFLIKKKIRQAIWQDNLSRFAAVMFTFNIIPYWLSVEVHPRYLFMFLPFVYYPLIRVYLSAEKNKVSKTRKFVEWIWFGLGILLAIAVIVLPFVLDTAAIPNVWLATIFVFLLTLVPLVLYYKVPAYRLVWFGFLLLGVKMGYNLIINPTRVPERNALKHQAQRIAILTAGQPLTIHDSKANLDGISFYITEQRRTILRRSSGAMQAGRFYLVHEDQLANYGAADSLLTIDPPHGSKMRLLIKPHKKKVNEGIFPQECLWQNPRPLRLKAECSNQRYHSGKKNAASSQAAQKKR
jgi:4-amino-4-deoxy-L-arabinose transferase-like glycosyltransferase